MEEVEEVIRLHLVSGSSAPPLLLPTITNLRGSAISYARW